MTESNPQLDTLDTALKNYDTTHSSTSTTSEASDLANEASYPPSTKAPAPTPVPTPLENTAGGLPSSSTAGNSTRAFPHNDKLDKKEQMKRLEHDIRKLLLWKQPVRSGAYFLLILGGLILSKSYSLIQIISALLTIVTAINLVYVNVTIQTQRILADRPGVNPYSALLKKDDMATMDRNFLQRSTELVADVVEAFLQRVSRIVLIENTATSAKWLGLFYIVWKLSAIISVRVLASLGTLLIFSVPLFYTRNQTCVDSKLLQGQAICQTHLEHAQEKVQQLWHQCLTRLKLVQPGGATVSDPSTSTAAAAGGSRKQD
ncbi:unnamed protein product [Absidia cylindrospora]